MMDKHGTTMLIIGVGSPNKKEHKCMMPQFKAPEGFSIPEGTKDGETFEATVTLKKQGDSLMVQAVDGYDLAKPMEKEESQEESSESETESEMGFLDAIEAATGEED